MSDVEFPDDLRRKIASFRDREREMMQADYKEASARVEFIDGFLAALGWDVSNAAGAPDRFKDVVVEPSQDVDGHKRAPDYVLRVEGNRKLFVEAKKPSIWIKNQIEPAYQVRRYSWSAQLPIAVLTNFRELAVYDGRYKPNVDDPARKARILYLKFTELEDNWDAVHGLLSREAVDGGSLDRYAAESSGKGGSERIDRVFLRDLEDARSTLLTHVAERNPTLTDAELLRAIQLTLDRIIFLRICEDRLVEPYGSLRTAVEQSNPRAALNELYRQADSRYNSGLFHFEEETGRVNPDVLTPSLEMDDDVVRQTILRFYPPNSPYAFGVMPVEVLGRAYESFLSQRITRAGGHVALELKPEIRKAGGVYYTPEWLTSEVLDLTLAPMLSGKTPEQLASGRTPLRILDPACGSGSFLVQGYRKLLDWHLAQYVLDNQRFLATRPPRLERNRVGELSLTLGERKRILLTHIFGVDIDEQAVEVAKPSLLLTLMEDQDASDIAQQLSIFKDRILPDMDSNVRCGNSLIGPDILSDDELADIHSPARAITRPFDWRTFHGGFSVIVGNPPWLMAGYEIADEALEYLKLNYDSYAGKADLYYLFIERSLGLLADGGRLGLVVPNKMYSTGAASELRKLLVQEPWIESIVDFQAAQLFEGATNYTQVLFASRAFPTAPEQVHYTRATPRMVSRQSWYVERGRLAGDSWDVSSPEAVELWDTITDGATPLASVVTGFGNGMQTGKDPILIVNRGQASSLKLEARYLRELVRGQDIRNGGLAPSERLVVFPYEENDGEYRVLTPSQLSRAPWLEAYLKANEAALRARKWFGKSPLDLTGQWWGLMHLDNASAFSGRHLVTPSLSPKANYALGDGRLFPTGTAGVTSVELPADIDEHALLALLNSTLLSAYVLGHSPMYVGGFHKFSTRHIQNTPIRLPDDTVSKEIWDRLGPLWRTRTSLPSGPERLLVDGRIDDLVNRLYGVDPGVLSAAVDQIRMLVDPSVA